MSSTPPPKPDKALKPAAAAAGAAAAGGAEGDAPAEELGGLKIAGDGGGEGPAVEYQISSNAKKNVSEILATDAEDESLRKYKESLLGSAAHGDVGDVNDPRRLIVEEFRVVFAPEEGQQDIVFQLGTPAGLERLKSEGMTMAEGSRFKFRISFRVQHDIIAGVKFVNSVSRMLATEKEELMIGSYPPSSAPHSFEFPKWDYNEAPKGMMFRGKYRVTNYFVDSDKTKHLEFDYELNIVKRA